MSKTVIRWIPDCNVCGLPLYERTSTTGGVCRGHPNIVDELDDILKQFEIAALVDYWKALADKRLELLKKVEEVILRCPECHVFWSIDEGLVHTDDCELAEAIDG